MNDITQRTLIIGYGNPYRRDDGVALHVMNMIRAELGRPPLALDDDGEDDLGHEVDTLMQHQLLPELVPLINRYDRLIFLDAHTGRVYPEAVRVARVEREFGFQAVTHHLSPGMLLEVACLQVGHAPDAQLVSVKGDDFDFGDELSPACAAAAREAAAVIQGLISN